MFKLPISATTLAIVCLCLSVPSAHAQQYFVDDGETVQPVYSGRPSDVQPDYWTVRLYRKGQAAQGRDNWGSISGKTAEAVMNELKESQRIEEEDERVNGPSSGTLTSFNYLGPIAVVKRPKLTLQKIKDAYDQIRDVKSKIDLYRDITSKEPKEVNPFKDVGRELREYTDELAEVQRRTHEIEKILDKLDPRFDEVSHQISEVARDINTVGNHRAALLTGGGGFGTPNTGWLNTRPNGRKEWMFFNLDGTARVARLGESGWYDASGGEAYRWRAEGSDIVWWKEGAEGKWRIQTKGAHATGQYTDGTHDTFTFERMDKSPLSAP
jgi:hypothetical protein